MHVCLRGWMLHMWHFLVYTLTTKKGHSKALICLICCISSSCDPILPLLPVSCFHFVSLCVCSSWKSIWEQCCPPNWPLTGTGAAASYSKSSCNDECAGASLTEDLFSIQWDTKREEAFNTNATICITSNCHFSRKWMGWGWDEGGSGILKSWLGGCWTTVGRCCCLPGEIDSERWGKD